MKGTEAAGAATVAVELREAIAVVAVAGEVDLANAAWLRAEVVQALSASAPGLVLDLTRTSYLDSRGVHLLLELADRMRTARQQLHVVAPEGGLIRRLLTLTHIDAIIPLHQSVDDALARLRGGAPVRASGSRDPRGGEAPPGTR